MVFLKSTLGKHDSSISTNCEINSPYIGLTAIAAQSHPMQLLPSVKYTVWIYLLFYSIRKGEHTLHSRLGYGYLCALQRCWRRYPAGIWRKRERNFWIGTRLSRAGNQNLGFFANRYSVYIAVAAAAAPQVNRGRESPPSLLLWLVEDSQFVLSPRSRDLCLFILFGILFSHPSHQQSTEARRRRRIKKKQKKCTYNL